jgi:hypothetical protein
MPGSSVRGFEGKIKEREVRGCDISTMERLSSPHGFGIDVENEMYR